MHNKFVVLSRLDTDGARNDSKNASESNVENYLVIRRDTDVIQL